MEIMVKHHTNYKTGETETLTKGEHFREHIQKCKGCGEYGFNLLMAKFWHDPVPRGEKYKFYQESGWIVLCDVCWLAVLEVPRLIIKELYKSTWPRARPVFGPEEDGKRFVGEYINRWPAKMSEHPAEHHERKRREACEAMEKKRG